MPKLLEELLTKEVQKKGFKKNSEKWRKYLFGTLRKTGWKPSTQQKSTLNNDK